MTDSGFTLGELRTQLEPLPNTRKQAMLCTLDTHGTLDHAVILGRKEALRVPASDFARDIVRAQAAHLRLDYVFWDTTRRARPRGCSDWRTAWGSSHNVPQLRRVTAALRPHGVIDMQVEAVNFVRDLHMGVRMDKPLDFELGWFLVNVVAPIVVPIGGLLLVAGFPLTDAQRARLSPMTTIKDGQLCWISVTYCILALYELHDFLRREDHYFEWAGWVEAFAYVMILLGMFIAAGGAVTSETVDAGESDSDLMIGSIIVTLASAYLFVNIHGRLHP